MLLISALEDNVHRILAKTLGVNALIKKPIHLPELVQRSTALIDLSRRKR